MLRAWRTKPRSSVREVVAKPYQFWILAVLFVLLAPVVIVSDLIEGTIGWRMAVNLTLVAVIVLWLVLWLRRPTVHSPQSRTTT